MGVVHQKISVFVALVAEIQFGGVEIALFVAHTEIAFILEPVDADLDLGEQLAVCKSALTITQGAASLNSAQVVLHLLANGLVIKLVVLNQIVDAVLVKIAKVYFGGIFHVGARTALLLSTIKGVALSDSEFPVHTKVVAKVVLIVEELTVGGAARYQSGVLEDALEIAALVVSTGAEILLADLDSLVGHFGELEEEEIHVLSYAILFFGHQAVLFIEQKHLVLLRVA